MKTQAASRCKPGRRAARGAVLLFAMIALVVLLVGTAALMRSMNTSLFTAGNFGFKRDLTNQGERAVAAVLDVVQAGALGTVAARQANATATNYSAAILATNDQGVPLALLTDAAFALVGVSGNDIALTDMGVTVRYVIDRLCVAAGPATQDGCTLAGNLLPAGSSSSELLRAEDGSSGGSGAVAPQVVYRVSIRVDGPRRTQSFFQSTFTI
jgi:type IV pilus assembly protein PilX